MDITINRVNNVERIFDYVATRFDNAVKYGVWHGGRAPLSGRTGLGFGRYIGDVMRYTEDVAYPRDTAHYWLASPNRGENASAKKWFGPFHSRTEASVWLTGYRKGESELAASQYTGPVESDEFDNV